MGWIKDMFHLLHRDVDDSISINDHGEVEIKMVPDELKEEARARKLARKKRRETRSSCWSCCPFRNHDIDEVKIEYGDDHYRFFSDNPWINPATGLPYGMEEPYGMEN